MLNKITLNSDNELFYGDAISQIHLVIEIYIMVIVVNNKQQFVKQYEQTVSILY